MIYPQIFYHTQAQSGKYYQRRATGTPDIARLIQGHADYWISPSPPRVLKNKKMILADWSVESWPDDKPGRVCMAIERLIAEGFEVYLWQTGLLKSLTKDNLACLNSLLSRMAMVPDSLASITHAAATQHKLSQDEIHVLDDYWIDHLLRESDELKPRNLSAICFSEVPEEKRDDILNLIRQSKPALESLILDSFTPGIISAWNYLNRHLPKELILPAKYRSVLLKGKEIQHLLEGKAISRSWLTLNLSDLVHTKELSLTSAIISSKEIQDLLAATPILNSFTFSSNEKQHSDLKLPPGSLAHLEKINLYCKNVSGDFLQPLLTSAPKLKELDINYCKNLSGDLKLLPGDLLDLKELNLRSTCIDANILEPLLKSAIHLKILNILSNSQLSGSITLSAESLAHLEDMNLSSSNITNDNLLALIAAAPNLKTLDLSLCEDILGDINFAPGSLLQLEIVDVGNTEITNMGLLALLAAAPKIKKLNISFCVNITEKLSFVAGSMNCLEEIDLSSSDIMDDGFLSLLACAPHLKTLKIVGCENISDIHTLLPGSLPLLEELCLTDSTITLEGLRHLLLAAPKLKKFDLHAYDLKEFAITLAPGSLPQLEEVDLSGCNITTEGIQALLAAAPHLKKLDLTGCAEIANSISLAPNSLPFLEEINLSGSKITSISMVSLLKATKNLKVLSLKSCKNIESELTLAPRSLLQLEEVNLTCSTFSNASFCALLEAAPNLKTINIAYCENIADLNLLAPGSLLQLEQMNLTDINVTADSLRALLTAAPRLKIKPTSAERDTSSDEERIESDSMLAPSVPKQPFQGGLLDANTALNPNKTFHLNRIFYPVGHNTLPAVNSYRLSVFQVAKTNSEECALSNAFYVNKDGDLGLKACSITKSAIEVGIGRAGGKLFFGKQKLALTNEWQALASLSPQEEMLRYNTTPTTSEVEMQYSIRDNLYYIRSTTSQQIDIDFTIHVPDEPPLALPTKIQEAVNYFLSFTPGILEPLKDKTSHSGEDYLKALMLQKKGACRHRAFAFKAWLERTISTIPSRIIYNNCHAFAEVKLGERWHRCDLGGYQAKMVIDESNKPLNEFERALQTWTKKKSSTGAVREYHQLYGAPGVKNILIECNTAGDADALHYALQAHGLSTSRPVFYVASPDDLMCSAPYMHLRDDNTGELRRGPGGALHAFLTSHADGILIVNYCAFKADDIVRFNTLVDKERKADGTIVPPDTIVIGLLNLDSPNPLPGSDFYSRFDVVEPCDFDIEQLAKEMPKLPITSIETVPHTGDPSHALGMTCFINLYNASNWEQRLLGSWVPSEGAWRYEMGELGLAISSGATTVEIQNGLWENKDFCRFWREASQSGVIKYAGRVIEIPKGMSFVRRDGYDWPKLRSFFQQKASLSDAPHLVLNPATIGNFFGHYQVTEDKQLSRLDGFIKAARANEPPVLHIHLTRGLSDDQWAMLMEECQGYEVKLVVYCAPGIKLPIALQAETIPDPMPWYQTKPPATAVIQSTDVDTTVANLVRNNPGCLVIDGSECHGSDLLVRTDAAFINKKDEPLRFEFSETVCALAAALDAGQFVILKGRCTMEMADELATFLLKRSMQTPPKGKLTIVSDDTSAFSYLACVSHEVSIDEKRAELQASLGVIPPSIEAKLACEPLSILEARGRFIQNNPGVDSDISWAGLSQVPKAINDPGVLTILPTKPFMEKRRVAINAVLSHQPYVFLTGLSGVGKTTFVPHELCQKTDTLYQGELALLNWAKDKTPGQRKILFLDEANLSPSEWSAFEGLFNSPPGILIDGVYCQLTPEHKVIFAGNPLSYGDERKLATFFQHHGNAIVFDPLPSNVLYETILKPIFKDTLLESKTADISTHFLDIYRFLCLCSKTDLLISPRELQMMALLTVSHCSRQEIPTDAEVIAKYFAYHLTQHLVPAARQIEFKSLFQSTISLPQNKKPSTPDFLITESRQYVNQMLEEFLALREIRHRYPGNEPQNYGGLGGIILDGEPGIGKSEMVIHALRARGYKELHDFTAPITTDKPFYRMPVSLSLADKETLLRKAFDKGAVVIIDEINSSPMMERLLNALLMGKTPEGTRPEHPGFMVIGTHNPISMGGRRAPSKALSRRMTTIELPPYPAAEMYNILLSKGLPTATAEALVNAYQTQSKFAQEHHLTPAPTFRDLLKLADQTQRAHQASTLRSEAMLIDKPLARIDAISASVQAQGFFAGFQRRRVDSAEGDLASAKPGAAKHVRLE